MTEKKDKTVEGTSRSKSTGKTSDPSLVRLSNGVPARLFDEDYQDLVEYEKIGLNMSDLIRRCVHKALPEVVAEVRDEIQQRLKPS